VSGFYCSEFCGWCGRCEGARSAIVRHCIDCDRVVVFHVDEEPHMPIRCARCDQQSKQRETLARVASAS
jgi:hypothetical protein